MESSNAPNEIPRAQKPLVDNSRSHSLNDRNISNQNINNNVDDETVRLFANKILEQLNCSPETVVNLSNHTLSIPERKLLEKGLNFCPTPVLVNPTWEIYAKTLTISIEI